MKSIFQIEKICTWNYFLWSDTQKSDSYCSVTNYFIIQSFFLIILRKQIFHYDVQFLLCNCKMHSKTWPSWLGAGEYTDCIFVFSIKTHPTSDLWPSGLGLDNSPIVSLERGKTP